jgi:prolyl-tRNA synthetase
MRFSQALIPTLKEDPTGEKNASHALLMRGGFIRRVGAGIYEYLPLGLRVLNKIESIVRREMDRAGALEVLLPALLPAEYFKETGRWDKFGETLLRLKDRKGADFHLGPTHEEIITDLVRHEIKSYRDLPKNLYQIQTKFRDEARPRGGLLRCREFLMKDAYSFDADEAGALASYERMRVAYTRIFDSIGLTYRMVAADSGAMGGSTSAEFQVLTNSGEDAIVACNRCPYAANVEAATVRPEAEPAEPAERAPLGKVHTPGHGTIAAVTAFLKATPDRMLKSLLYTAKDGPFAGKVFLGVVRGDHEVNEIKLAHAVGAGEIFLATDAEIEKATGAKVGFAGPVGFVGKIVVDPAAKAVVDGKSGANETDYHTTGVQFGRDYQGDVVDLRLAKAGDGCPMCDGVLESYRGIEGGHIFVLGTHYSAAMGASFLAENGDRRPLVMGCYGIGVSRLLAAAVEQHHDDDGILWPAAIAPYDVEIVTIGADAAVKDVAETILTGLEARGVDVLWDDREERPGVKFKDADLIGLPLRIVIGAKGLAAGGVECKPRQEKDPKKAERVPVAEAVEAIAARIGR